jgi:hypothetical protein
VDHAGVDTYGYRQVLSDLLRTVGFVEQRTDDPDIVSSAANVLLARVGSRVPPERAAAFRARLVTRKQ